MRFDSVIFDFDGTLMDSMPSWSTLTINYLARFSIVPTDEVLEKFHSLRLEDCASYMKDLYGLEGTPDEIFKGMISMIMDDFENRIPLKQGVLELLEWLYEHSVKMCIATTTDSDVVMKGLRRTGIDKYFDFIITCGEVGKNKRYPDIYLGALEKLGSQKSRTAVVEDAPYAVKTAKEAGFPVIAVKDPLSSAFFPTLAPDPDIFVGSLSNEKIYCFLSECEI